MLWLPVMYDIAAFHVACFWLLEGAGLNPR
jgi:hypothetical protein